MEYKDIAQKGNINYLTLDQPTTFIFKLPYLMNNIDQEDENEFNQNIEYTQSGHLIKQTFLEFEIPDIYSGNVMKKMEKT